MKDFMMIEKDNSINLSIQLVNDISVYAKRMTTVTLHTAEVIKTSISDIAFASFRSETNWDSMNRDYLNKVAKLVENFGQKVDQAITTENIMIKRKEDISQIEPLKKILRDWEPLALMTKGWITILYDWFQYRMDQLSKSYLNKLIEKIHFMEVKNDIQ